MNGYINLYKDSGITSNKALNRLKGILNFSKVGFLGTLDPCAEGVLPIGVGFGTKFFPYFERTPKVYEAEIIFGSETDTQDSTGTITKTGSPDLASREKLESALEKFTGEIEQVPPMYSAKKVDGKRLYEIARKGGEVKRKSKRVTIHSIELTNFSEASAHFTAKVSTGTYIRTLCEDIGREIGSLAHMGALTRTESHIFKSDTAITLSALEEKRGQTADWLLPLDYPLSFLEKVNLTSAEERSLRGGGALNTDLRDAEFVRLYGASESFIGVGKINPVVRKLVAAKLVPA